MWVLIALIIGIALISPAFRWRLMGFFGDMAGRFIAILVVLAVVGACLHHTPVVTGH